ASDSLDASRKSCSEITKHIEELEAAIEKSKSDIITYMNEGSSLKAKTGRYDSMLENINFRKTQLKQRYLQFKSDEQADRMQYDEYDGQLKQLEADINRIQEDIDACEEALRKNQELTHENRAVITEQGNALSAAASKQEALRNITERYDGYGNSIRRVMDQKEKNSKIIGVVADIIEVKKEYEIAVETALGGSIQNIVTEDEETAKQMIRYLKDNRFGRATFLPLTNLHGSGFSKPEALKEEGVIGLASTLVDVKDKYRPVAESLLGRILVVDHIDHALAVAKKYRHSLRIVTTGGELLNPGGSMTGGAYKNSSNLLGRKRELDEIGEKVNALKLACIEAQKKDEKLQAERAELKAKKEEGANQLQQLYLDKNTITVNIEQISKRLADAAITFASVSREEKELDAQIEELNTNKNQLSESNAQQKEAIAACEAQISTYETQLFEEKKRLAKGNQSVSDCMIAYNSMKQQQEFIAENVRRIKAEEDKLRQELAGYTGSMESYAETITRLTGEIALLRQQMEQSGSDIVEKQAFLEESNQKRASITSSHRDFLNQRETLSEQISGLEQTAFKLEAQIEKVTEKLDLLNQYMWEEYELTAQNIKALRDEAYNDLEELKKLTANVKTQIKELGDVNVNAIEDYKSVSERYEFLKAQHDDIVTAEENLIGIIQELDTAMKQQFEEKFHEIQLKFDSVFKELFGGGKSSLELVDEEDLLETGIRIIAQPPGKKLQNMMQLSGGEKSLTAIALLFAIQSLKPSPFCLLDEIEAALDDSNVNRFAKYLNKLTKDT
ncbi:MAG: chromosome segregation protein SMC, partial [Lachnospiraceae bacterium]|nr:chromosome segregation protein SMC [Lachnospiraceae bacterium]